MPGIVGIGGILNCQHFEIGFYILQHRFKQSSYVIASCNVVRDLGIQVDSHLKFHEHTTAVTKKANRLLSIIHKAFQYFDKVTFINLYKIIFGLCRPAISGKVQKRATRLVHNLRGCAYENRFVELNLPSLKYLRCRGDMIMMNTS